MELVAEELLAHAGARGGFELARIQPTLWRPRPRSSRRVPGMPERLWGRLIQYPVHVQVRGLIERFAAYHIVDHSYAHLAYALPKGRPFGIYCHDLDALSARVSTAFSPRRWLATTILGGLRRAHVIFYATRSVEQQIQTLGFVPRERLVYAPYGISTDFTTQPGREPARFPSPYLLHVGSLIARKNPDFLLELLRACHMAGRRYHLVQVGGEWTAAQLAFQERNQLGAFVHQVRGIARRELAGLYRGACAVLLPSLAEGFGLPVAEALACGSLVLASDLPVLREVGGEACVYAPVSALSEWVKRLFAAVNEGQAPPLTTRVKAAQRFSWDAHAATILNTYTALLSA